MLTKLLGVFWEQKLLVGGQGREVYRVDGHTYVCLQVNGCWCQFSGDWSDDLWPDKCEPGLAV